MRKKTKASLNRRILKNIKEGSDENLNKGIEISNGYTNKKREERKRRIYSKIENETKDIKNNIRPLIIAFIVIILFFITYTFIEYSPKLGIKLINQDHIPVTILDNISNKSSYRNYNNELLIYSDKKLTTYNSRGKKTWEYNINDESNLEVYINNSYMVLVNKNTGNIYIFSGKNEIANKKIEGNIDDIFLDEKGNIAIEYSSSGYKKIITVIDKYGKNKYSAYITAEAILDIKLMDNGNKLLLVQTDSSSMTIGTKISIIDSNKKESLKEVLNLKNKLLYDLRFLNDEIIFVTNNNLKKYNVNTETNTEIHNLDINQTNYVALSNNYFVTIETSSESFNFITRKFDGTKINNIGLENMPKYVKNSGLLTYIVSENNILVINKWGMKAGEFNIKLPPREIIIFDDEKCVALIYSGKIEIIRL